MADSQTTKITLANPDEPEAWDRFVSAALIGVLADSNRETSGEQQADRAAKLADLLIVERRKRAQSPEERDAQGESFAQQQPQQ